MVGRETFRNLGERVRNAMNIRRGGGDKNLARSGRNPHHARAISASRSTTAWAVAIVVAMIAAVTVMFVPAPAAQADSTTVVDPDTTNVWSDIAASSTNTQNIGRIWTDKSVFNSDYDFEGALDGTSVAKGDDSDFLVGLSAISSTSNLKSTVTNTTPLDIVLVVDTSGSMDNNSGHDMGYAYSPAYDVNDWGTYYIQVNGRWTELDHNNQGWYYWSRNNRTYVTPARWEGDTEGGRVQFYTRSNQQMSRMEALQNAANAFVDSVAAMNDNISDTAQQHRISLVKFASDENNSIGNDTNRDGYNYSQVVSDLTAYTSQTASTLKNTINSLEGEGATRADYGMHQAQRVLDGEGDLTGARTNAQKIVIFFTDGNPTTSSSWSDSVAGTAINYAYDMKQDGALVYSIGVFQGANPSDTNNDFNRYMNAVSSNYPDAECADNVNVGSFWNPQYEWRQTDDYGDLVLGDRVEGAEGEETPQYYFAASNADELNQVFEDITESLPINQGSGSPIEEVEGAAGTPGYLTFTDTLGSFMEVTGVGADNNKMYLAFADGLHEGTTSDGGNTWTFSGVVNEGNGVNTAYPEGADLSEIKVTVTKSNDLATGDIITVQIPASLIPMRNYDVDTDNGTMTVNDTFPVRLFYGVSVKDGVIDALNNPQDANHDAVLAQTSADGKTIDFYSNSFLKKAAAGSTTASFTPNSGNKFYYYTSDTPVYTDQNGTRAYSWDIERAQELYVQDTYWVTDSTGTHEQTDYVPITIGGAEYDAIDFDRQGAAYIPAHTQRTDRPKTLEAGKSRNETGTASMVIVPSWTENDSVTQALGNNGKISYPMPGSLEIKKMVDWGNASDQTKQDKNEFTFDITANVPTGEDGKTEPLSGTYNYYVGDTANGTVKFTDGAATLKVTGDTTVRIEGLPAGATFTVTERNVGQNGWTVTDGTTQVDADNTNTTDGIVTGTIESASQVSLTFDNAYKATDVKLSDVNTALKVNKDLQGRDWRDGDTFTFNISAAAGTPLPDPASITVDDKTSGHTASFGDITFTAPGTYTYTVTENNDPDQPLIGVNYSGATYTVKVQVTDNGEGKLVIPDDGVTYSQTGGTNVTDNTMVFTNNYVADVDDQLIDAVKIYNDATGGNPITEDNKASKFTFQIEAKGGYKTQDGSAGGMTIDAADVPMPAGTAEGSTTATTGIDTITQTGGTIQFPAISFTGNHVGNTYVYEVSEVEGGEQGMNYSEARYTIKIAVTEKQDPDGTTHVVATPDKNPSDISFENSYTPTAATLEGADAIHGTKTLTGREMKDDEAFYFQLTQNSGPETILENSETVSVAKADMKDGSADFDFSKMTFAKTGTYTFTVKEVADEKGGALSNGSGMTYDTNVCTVTVNVTDNHDGTLKAVASYSNDVNSSVTDKAQFNNVYKASMNYGSQGAGGINVTKTLNGRPLFADEFNFSITGQGDAAGLVADADSNFTNGAAADGVAATMAKLQNLSFNQDDAGKTYTFTVKENVPAEDDRLARVTYDQSEYEVAIQVLDNGDGSMHTLTTVTKTKDVNGKAIDGGQVVINAADSDADGYAIPTFGFVNQYNPTPAEAGKGTNYPIQVTKTVTGAPSPNGVTYGFTLTATGDNITNITGLDEYNQLHVHTNGTIEAGKSQTLDFDKLTFTKPGTYTFTVQEDEPTAANGWSYDTSAKTVTVKVTALNEQKQYDGKLYIQSVDGSPATVTNSYAAEPVIVGGDGSQQQITVQKSVTGADSTAGFQFQIEPVDPDDSKWKNVKPVGDFADKITIAGGVKQGEPKTASFAGIQFNATGEYLFKITEVGAADFNKGDAEARAGWTYDEHKAIVTVNVTDDNFDGQLDAAVSYDNGAQAAEFTNKYEAGSATLTGSESFTGTKTIKGRNGIEGEKFGFTLKPGDAADGGSWDAVTFQPKDGDAAQFTTASATATMSKGGNSADFSFDGTFTFSKAGTYTFNVTETGHNGKDLPKDGANGMTYDRHTGTITVKVTDDGKGNLHATAEAGTITEGDGENDMTFENAYQATPGRWGFADGELLGGHKYINDTTGGTYTLEANQFSFTMRAQAEGNPMPEGWDGTTVDDQGRGMMTVTNGTGNATDVSIYDFGWIEFTHADMAGATEVENKPGVFAKTFQYNIFETGTMPAGISRDNTAYTVTFTVTEDHNTGKITVATPTATKIVEGSGGAGDPADVTKLDFTNTYNPTSIEGHQNFFKTLVGRNWQQGDSFTFDVSMTATEADGSEWPAGAPLPSVKASDGYDFSEVKTNAADNGLDYTVTINPSSQTGNTYRFDTGTITYEREGIYTWTVSEQQSTVDHVTSDGTVYTITVTVTDEGGVLKRSVQVTGGNYTDHDGDQTLDFTNVYKPNEVTTDDQGGIGNIQVTKKVEGNATSAAFNFKLTLENGDAANVLTNKDDPQSAFPADGITKATSGDFADGDTKAVDFGALTFTAEGDYTFKVVETDDAPANWTYANGDANAKTITIHVTDPDNGGQLVASYDQDAANNPTFTNSYKAEGTLDGDAEGAKNLMVAKTIDGRKFQKDDTFSFQLTADKNNPAGVTLPKNADGLTIAYADGDDTNSKTAAFGDIKFTLPGTYTFHVSEKVPADAGKLGGMTYSDEQYTVTVEVTDAQDGNGKLDAVITKIVNKSGDEVDGLAFTNTYEPGGTTDLPETGEGSIQLRKVLTGKAWDGDEFKFQLTAKGATTPDGSGIADVPMPGVAEKTISDKTGTEDGNDYADFGFGSITYSQAGTYVYEVTEIPGGNAGISYDGHTATVTVSVVDNLHGGFTATASVANGTFTNVYKSELDYQAAGGLEIAKTFENADMREFSFTVKPADQASADKLGIKLDGETLTTTPGATIGDDNASHTTVSIGAGTDVTFTQADADKTYTYTVQENVGSNAGVNYDGTVYTVTITTVDDGQGGIQVTTTVADAAGNTQSYVYDNDDATDDQPAVIPFTNTYTATGELGGNGSTSIKATKTLANRPMTDGEFTFNVTNAADQNNTVVATGTNAADGTVTFSPISYSAGQMLTDATNGLAQKSVVDDKNTFTYQYTVAEDQASFDEGVTAIAGSFGITVTVTDNGDGTLGIAVTYPDGGDGLTFRNAYGEGEQGQATLNIAGEKKLDVQSGNNAPNIAGKYTFTLTGEDGAPMPDTTTATNDAAGNVTFGDVTYTMENVFGDTGDDGTATLSAQRTRTFTYTVTESGAVDGVANDPEASKTFTVTVTDNGDGTLSAVSDPAQGAKFSFTNTYSVKPTDSSATGKGGITVTKKLTGRDLQDGEFSFELVDHNGQKVAEGTNDADGNVELGAVTFTEPGVYPYTIREVNTALASVDYDAAEHAVTATVTDNGDGTLSVTWKLDGDTPATFTNTYDPVDASVVIGASKVLDGRELKDGEFTFQLTGADESTPMPEDAKDGVSTATNAANGSIGFGTIVYDQAGTYKYTVSEVNDKQDGVTYDDTTYEVTVTVTDNTAEGRLEATVDYGDATALVFTNTYKKAEATIPKTGAAVILPSVIGFILLLGAGGMYASKRRKRS